MVIIDDELEKLLQQKCTDEKKILSLIKHLYKKHEEICDRELEKYPLSELGSLDFYEFKIIEYQYGIKQILEDYNFDTDFILKAIKLYFSNYLGYNGVDDLIFVEKKFKEITSKIKDPDSVITDVYSLNKDIKVKFIITIQGLDKYIRDHLKKIYGHYEEIGYYDDFDFIDASHPDPFKVHIISFHCNYQEYSRLLNNFLEKYGNFVAVLK